MNLRRLSAVARKETLHIRRDPRSLGLAIGIPMLMLLMFGYALTLDVDRVPLVIWDQSGTVVSRDFLAQFTGSRYFQLRAMVSDDRAIEQAIDRRDADIALVIPPNFAQRIESRQPA